jgi:hypothetical protein
MVVAPDIASLFEAQPYGLPRGERESRLLCELTAEHGRHYESCALYRRICDTWNWQPDRDYRDLADLPFLYAQAFKEAGTELVSVPAGKGQQRLNSSATSGRPSTIVLDRDTARRQARAVSQVLASFIGPQRRPMLVCDPQPTSTTPGEVSARAAAMLGFMTFASSRDYALEAGMKADPAAIDTFASTAMRGGAPVTLIGFTFVLYVSLLGPLAAAGKRWVLPPGSTILHIGGWKRLEDQKVDRAVLAAAAEAVFGIPPDGIIDTYGFTEQMGTVHAECTAGHKHAPAFSDLVVRDPVTLKPLPDGSLGLGQFLSLVPASYPGFSVLTDDLVRVTGRDRCRCGRRGTTFVVEGRHKAAEVRGCGDVLAEKILVGGGIRPAPAAIVQPEAARAVQLFSESKAYRTFTGDIAFPVVRDWPAFEARLRGAQNELQKLAVDDILGVLHVASRDWENRDSPFGAFHANGLAFLINFIKRGALQRMVDRSLRGGRGVLDDFHHDPASESRWRALPLGVVGHWIAGNVPTLGFLSLLLSLATKNANVLKVPEHVSPLLTEMLGSVARARYRTPGGRWIDGEVVSNAVVALWYPHQSGDADRLSMMVDARIVWGGAEAVMAIANLPRKHTAQDVIFGPKLSIAAVGREALSDEARAVRVARSVAVDCSVFDQEACASAHTVFVERGGAISPLEFSRLLAVQMDRALVRIPHAGLSGQTAGDIKSARIRHLLDGAVFAPFGLEWTVLHRDETTRPQPIYGRTAFVRPVDDLADIGRLVDRDTQAVGLALPGRRRTVIAEQLALAGVDRVTDAGAMAEFTVPWDGVFLPDRLVRWISLAR